MKTKWVEPGQKRTVVVYASWSMTRPEAIASALKMASAHDCTVDDVRSCEPWPQVLGTFRPVGMWTRVTRPFAPTPIRWEIVLEVERAG